MLYTLTIYFNHLSILIVCTYGWQSGSARLACEPTHFFFERKGGVEVVAVCSSGAAVARNSCRRSHAERATALQRKVCRVLCTFFGTT